MSSTVILTGTQNHTFYGDVRVSVSERPSGSFDCCLHVPNGMLLARCTRWDRPSAEKWFAASCRDTGSCF